MGEATGIQGRWWPGSFHLPSVSVEFGGLRLRALGLHRRHANTCQLLVDDVSTSRRLLGLLDELLEVWRLPAACACARIFEKWLQKLRGLTPGKGGRQVRDNIRTG